MLAATQVGSLTLVVFSLKYKKAQLGLSSLKKNTDYSQAESRGGQLDASARARELKRQEEWN